MAVATTVIERGSGFLQRSSHMRLERRSGLRAPTSLVATLRRQQQECPVVVLDLSPDGALIETEAPPQASAAYELRFNVFGETYFTPVDVVHWRKHHDAYLWGCRLAVSLADQRRLCNAVKAVLGLSGTYLRPWAEIRQQLHDEAASTEILVGRTPSGREIELTPRDCVEMGPDGVELYVRTISSIEAA